MDQWKVKYSGNIFSLKKADRGAGLYDYDGNEYQSIIIGSQEWLLTNYSPIHYANGEVIENITGVAEWNADIGGAWCYYNNDQANLADYGRLYNQYAIKNANGFISLERDGAVETDWRIPSSIDYSTLSGVLGGSSVAGGKMKEIGLTYWTSPNTGATNSSGFSARGGGRRGVAAGFWGVGASCPLWVSSDTLYVTMWNTSSMLVFSAPTSMHDGLYVRLVRDI